jgi:SPP1 family predicted phage head-tail adaptor
MSAGKRDKLVTIQQYTSGVRDSSGLPTEPWTNLGQEWMSREEVTKQSMEERLHAGGMAAAFETSWTLPYRQDMDPETVDVPKKRRLVYSGRTFDITRAVLSDRVARNKIILETIASSFV